VQLLEMRESDWDDVLDINLKSGCSATIAFRQGADGGLQERWLGDQRLLASNTRCRASCAV